LRYTEKPPAAAAETAAASKSKKKSADKDKEEEDVRRGRHAALDSLLRMGQQAAGGEEKRQSEQTEKLVVTLEVEILDDGEYKQFTQIGVALTTRRLNKQVSRQQVFCTIIVRTLSVHITLVFRILERSRRFSQAVPVDVLYINQFFLCVEQLICSPLKFGLLM
jgi:hypothetical protein